MFISLMCNSNDTCIDGIRGVSQLTPTRLATVMNTQYVFDNHKKVLRRCHTFSLQLCVENPFFHSDTKCVYFFSIFRAKMFTAFLRPQATDGIGLTTRPRETFFRDYSTHRDASFKICNGIFTPETLISSNFS